MTKPERTQYFDAMDTDPKYPGRYLYKSGAKRPVMRWWNGTAWQLNRRKAIYLSVHHGDQWAGAATCDPEVEKMLAMGLASSDKQPVKISERIDAVALMSVPVRRQHRTSL